MRDYRLIRNGKFAGETVFKMNVSSSLFIGRVCDLLGLPVDASPVGLTAPHKVTGETQMRFLSYLKAYDRKDLVAAVKLANEEQSAENPSTPDDVEWVLLFFKLALNPEGCASEYCDEYYDHTENETTTTTTTKTKP